MLSTAALLQLAISKQSSSKSHTKSQFQASTPFRSLLPKESKRLPRRVSDLRSVSTTSKRPPRRCRRRQSLPFREKFEETIGNTALGYGFPKVIPEEPRTAKSEGLSNTPDVHISREHELRTIRRNGENTKYETSENIETSPAMPETL